MTERKPGKRQERKQSPERERRILFSDITIAAWSGEISAHHLYDPNSGYIHGSTSGMHSLDRAVADLADGGFVFDLRPLADHPKHTSWVFHAPISDGRITGEEIDRLSDGARIAAGELAPFLGGHFQDLALLAAAGVDKTKDGSAGGLDYVSASYMAMYWGSRGALIGRRSGNTLHWSDGREQKINENPDVPSQGTPTRRDTPGK